MDDSKCNHCSCDGECVVESKRLSIPKLPDTDVCLNRLAELDFSSSGISKVPDLQGNFVNLTKLNLSSNELVSLPQELSKCQRLTHLILSHNKLERIPPCLNSGMGSITTLDLSYNRLLDFNTKPFCVQRLMSLNVCHNSNLSCLPQWLWSIECKSLESLDISFTSCLNDVKEDPYQNIYGISRHLKHLNVTNTGSKEFKLDFVKHLKNLRSIVLDSKNTLAKSGKHHNYLPNIPMIFNYRYKCVTSLSLSNVYLTTIGNQVHFGLPNLVFLNLAYNAIGLLTDSLSKLTNLEVLDLSHNQLLSVPDSFKNLKKLKTFMLNSNELSIFPKILDDLLNLEFLDLYDNKLFVCPSWSINSSIKSLDLEQNMFSMEINTDQNVSENYPENYSEMLKNLRSLIHEVRKNGQNQDLSYLSEIVSNDDSHKSGSHWSLNSYSDDLNCTEENKDDTNFEPEEFWESESYEQTTALFDPKEYESKLLKEIMESKKPLTADQKTQEKNIFRAVAHSTNMHYFCPSDELPAMISK